MNATTAGRCFRAIAVFGVVTALVLGVTGWLFLTDLDENLDQSLQIGETASVSVIETIDVAEQLIESLDAGLVTVGATLGAVESTLGDTAGVASTTASLSATLPQSFDDIDVALSTVETLSGAIDSALSGLSNVPFGPDYDPAVPLPVAIRNLRAAFDPIGDDLTRLTTELQNFADGSGDVGGRVDSVRGDLAETRAALANSSALLDDYRRTATDAGLLAASSRGDMSRAFALARFAVLMLALFVVVAQFVPWWLAGRLSSGQVSLGAAQGTDGSRHETADVRHQADHDVDHDDHHDHDHHHDHHHDHDHHDSRGRHDHAGPTS